MTELKYDQLTAEQLTIVDAATIEDLAQNLYLAEESGRIIGYRLVEMLDNGVPVKWGEASDLNGMPLPKKKKTFFTKLAAEKVRLASEPAEAAGLTRLVSIHVIDRCPLNPRKRFDRGRLDELKASFRAHGFVKEMSHLWVRPHPVQPNRFELVDGERTWTVVRELVAEEGFGEMVPIAESALSDAQVIEFGLVNALQREELSPLEEAAAFEQLIGLKTPAGESRRPALLALADSTGCSLRHIQYRLSLNALSGTKTGEALAAGKLPVSHARELAQVPSDKARTALLARVLNPSDGRGVIPFETLQEWIEAEVKVALHTTDFDPSDALLVPVEMKDGRRTMGGACDDCPFNTRNQREEEDAEPVAQRGQGKGGGGHRAAMCLHPDCFRAKRSAGYAAWRAGIETDASLFTIEAEAAARLWDHTGKRLAPNSGYVELAAKPEEWELKAGVKDPRRWADMVKDTEVRTLVVKDEGGRIHRLIHREAAKSVARERGYDIFRGAPGAAPAGALPLSAGDDGDPRIASAAAGVQRDAARADEVAEREELARKDAREALLAERTDRALDRELFAAVCRMKLLTWDFWRLVLVPMIDAVRANSALCEVCQGLGLPAAKIESGMNDDDLGDWLEAAVRSAPGEHLPAIALLLARHMLYSEDAPEWLRIAGKNLQLDAKAVRRAVVAQLESEEEIARLEAEIANGVAWRAPLREEASDFAWDTAGDCTTPNTAELAMPKGVKHTARIAVARTVKGWAMGYEVRLGKKTVANWLPNRNDAGFSNAALASRTALLAVRDALRVAAAPAAAINRVAAYLDRVQIPAEKPAKAARGKKGGDEGLSGVGANLK